MQFPLSRLWFDHNRVVEFAEGMGVRCPTVVIFDVGASRQAQFLGQLWIIQDKFNGFCVRLRLLRNQQMGAVFNLERFTGSWCRYHWHTHR